MGRLIWSKYSLQNAKSGGVNIKTKKPSSGLPKLPSLPKLPKLPKI